MCCTLLLLSNGFRQLYCFASQHIATRPVFCARHFPSPLSLFLHLHLLTMLRSSPRLHFIVRSAFITFSPPSLSSLQYSTSFRLVLHYFPHFLYIMFYFQSPPHVLSPFFIANLTVRTYLNICPSLHLTVDTAKARGIWLDPPG